MLLFHRNLVYFFKSTESFYMGEMIQHHLKPKPHQKSKILKLENCNPEFLLTFVCFEQFHHDRNQSLSFIQLTPPRGAYFYNFFGLHKLTKKESPKILFQHFLGSQNMKILMSTHVLELVKVNENTSTQYMFNHFLG